MTASSKPVLFYSNFCAYSQAILRDIVRLNCKSAFVIVCIDDKIDQMPSFLDRVPTILTPNRDVLTDDKVQRYIELVSNSDSEDVLPCSLHDICQGLSDAYSYIEAPEGNHLANPNYVSVNDRLNAIPTPEMQQKGRQDGSSDMFEKLKSQRDQDLQKIYQNVQPRY